MARKGHESDPEKTGGELREGDSPAWNSLDEAGLWDYHKNCSQQSDSDDMEVTKRLSSLNFSMIPCVLDPKALDVSMTAEASDVDHFSELTSATHLDILPTFYSDRDNSSDVRQSRKRSSRRRPNKRTKRIKCSTGLTDTSHTTCRGEKLFIKAPSNLTQDSQKRLKRSRSLRKVRRPGEDDSLSCFLSDTSAMCEMDTTVGGSFHRGEEEEEEEGESEMLDSTPPAVGPQSLGVTTSTQPELSANDESDLTETTTDRYYSFNCVHTSRIKSLLCRCLLTYICMHCVGQSSE